MKSYVVTFDCYGTLIDWEAGISAAFASAGCAAPREAVLSEYTRVEPIVESQGYMPYRDVLKETSLCVLGSLGGKVPPGREDFLPQSLPHWPPFEDTNAALRRLAEAGFRLGILSNVDDDLLAATCRQFSVRFDFTITAQQVRSYKPAHPHFLAARETLKGARWMHAAQSYFHDVAPCLRLGIPVAWVNRRRQSLPADGQSLDLVFPDLAKLADHLGA
jgi:2-haloacid dehalogenase/putative hydrolase of the HAD superfamily